MRKTWFLLFSHFLFLFLSQHDSFASDSTRIRLIPQPVSLNERPGWFVLDASVSIQIDAPENSLDSTEQWFNTQITAATGISLQKRKSGKKSIRFQLVSKTDKSIIGDEGYTLSITPSTILMRANTPEGMFYGLQTLLQLLPVHAALEFGMKKPAIPCADIVDYPRFGWRGLMLDVSRHFFTKEEVKKFIDEMVRYKYNLLHLHLSDDQGWRIEIKRYPRLTAIGGYRPQTMPPSCGG